MKNDSPHLYFAYGSNLFQPWLERRVGSVTVLAIGFVPVTELRYNKRSTDGSGKANLVQSSQILTPAQGVIYRLSALQLESLDRAEGAGKHYARTIIPVNVANDTLDCQVYLAKDDYIDDDLQPYTWYRDLILAGARSQGLTDEYIQFLARFEAAPDPKLARERKARILLNKAEM